jgi:long-subunit acyl-CoA synthetase (AMP-forming)
MFIAPVGFIYYDYSKLFGKLEQEIPELEKFVVLNDLGGKYDMSIESPKYADYETYLKQYNPDASALPRVDISPHDMVNVQFTSGSTGLPKNVALSHYNIMVRTHFMRR